MKFNFLIMFIISFFFVKSGFAQNEETTIEYSDPTDGGNWFLEANTGSFTTGNTSISFISIEGELVWSVGVDGGIFIADDLALKAGFGVTAGENQGFMVYKVGVIGYIGGKVPIGIDYTGTTNNDLSFNRAINWLGLQIGHSIFINDYISIQPNVRYNYSLTENTPSVLQGNIGFVLFFKS